MENNRYLLGAIAFVLATSASAGANVGLVKLNDEKGSYLYSANKITPGDSIYFQYPEDGKPACCAKGNWKAATLVAADPDATDYGSGRQLYRYRLGPSVANTNRQPFIGMAVFGKNLAVTQVSPFRLAFGTGADGAELSLCTSQEGVHVVGKKAKGIHAHLYLYLAYDIENPTCDDSQR